MDGMDDLVQFLRARLDEDALWATEASRRSGEPAVEGGVHWQWVDPETDEAIAPAPDRDEFVGGEDRFRVSLRSRETWPNPPWELPQFAIPTAEEIPTAVGGHIARHDPARVLAEVEAKRKLLTEYAEVRQNEGADYEWAGGWASGLGKAVALMALPYADHPDYRDTWRP